MLQLKIKTQNIYGIDLFYDPVPYTQDDARVEAVTVVWLMIQVFSDVTLFRLVCARRRAEISFCLRILC
jgi:hypothetical protein